MYEGEGKRGRERKTAKTRKEKKGKTGRQMVTDKKNSRKTSDMHMTTHLIPLIAHALTHLS